MTQPHTNSYSLLPRLPGIPLVSPLCPPPSMILRKQAFVPSARCRNPHPSFFLKLVVPETAWGDTRGGSIPSYSRLCHAPLRPLLSTPWNTVPSFEVVPSQLHDPPYSSSLSLTDILITPHAPQRPQYSPLPTAPLSRSPALLWQPSIHTALLSHPCGPSSTSSHSSCSLSPGHPMQLDAALGIYLQQR